MFLAGLNNADQRITEDVEKFSFAISELYSHTLKVSTRHRPCWKATLPALLRLAGKTSKHGLHIHTFEQPRNLNNTMYEYVDSM